MDWLNASKITSNDNKTELVISKSLRNPLKLVSSIFYILPGKSISKIMKNAFYFI